MGPPSGSFNTVTSLRRFIIPAIVAVLVLMALSWIKRHSLSPEIKISRTEYVVGEQIMIHFIGKTPEPTNFFALNQLGACNYKVIRPDGQIALSGQLKANTNVYNGNGAPVVSLENTEILNDA